MDSKKSMYFQNNTTTPSIRQLKKRLSNTKEAETIAKKAKRKNIDSVKETVRDSTVNMDTILETSSTKSINTIQETAKESNLDTIQETQEQQSISFSEVGSERLKYDFFNVNCEVLAKKLLGKVLVRNLGDSILKGRIVETECYPGGEDKASHSCNGKKTPRNKPMFMKPGTCYVYLTYGMYHCFNISCQGDGAAVLIRALEPLEGVDKMQENRLNFQGRKHKPPGPRKEKQIQSRDLCNGPGKLTVALAIDREANEKDICVWRGLYIETSQEVNDPIVASTRIGIDSCGEEAVKRLWRYYLYGNRCVSKFDRLREKGIMQTVADQT